jgi:hypothetical protein
VVVSVEALPRLLCLFSRTLCVSARCGNLQPFSCFAVSENATAFAKTTFHLVVLFVVTFILFQLTMVPRLARIPGPFFVCPAAWCANLPLVVPANQ